MTDKRTAYDVLAADAFDYYEAFGAVLHFEFEEIPDRSFQLGSQVTRDQVQYRGDGTIRVSVEDPGDHEMHRVSFYQHGGVQWREPWNGVHTPEDVRVRVPLLDREVAHV